MLPHYSQARQAHDNWKSTVLIALQEVENAQLSYSGSVRTVRASQKTVRLYGESRDLTRRLVEQGGATVPALIDTEVGIADADVVLASAKRQLALDFAALNVSLGAGSNVKGYADEPEGLSEDIVRVAKR